MKAVEQGYVFHPVQDGRNEDPNARNLDSSMIVLLYLHQVVHFMLFIVGPWNPTTVVVSRFGTIVAHTQASSCCLSTI